MAYTSASIPSSSTPWPSGRLLPRTLPRANDLGGFQSAVLDVGLVSVVSAHVNGAVVAIPIVVRVNFVDALRVSAVFAPATLINEALNPDLFLVPQNQAPDPCLLEIAVVASALFHPVVLLVCLAVVMAALPLSVVSRVVRRLRLRAWVRPSLVHVAPIKHRSAFAAAGWCSH